MNLVSRKGWVVRNDTEREKIVYCRTSLDYSMFSHLLFDLSIKVQTVAAKKIKSIMQIKEIKVQTVAAIPLPEKESRKRRWGTRPGFGAKTREGLSTEWF